MKSEKWRQLPGTERWYIGSADYRRREGFQPSHPELLDQREGEAPAEPESERKGSPSRDNALSFVDTENRNREPRTKNRKPKHEYPPVSPRFPHPMNAEGRIAVAMSGGVDSSTTAYLLKKQGYEVVGVSMQMYNSLDRAETEYGGCCTLDDLADARRVAWKLDIPHFVVNMESGFHEKVILPFVRDYLKGSTPSPCVLCNTHVKFDSFHRKALTAGAKKVATGHYARVTRGDDGTWELRKARDLAKDQSYFLFELTQEQLSHAIFPLGELTKPEVRELAREAELAVASKKESYEICFVPQKDSYAAIVAEESKALALEDDPLAQSVAEGEAGGEIVDTEGHVLGHHDGYYHFTIGQRRGIGLGGTAERSYVVDINPFTRRVVVGPESALEETVIECERTHWISGSAPDGPIEVAARIRSRAADVAATVEPLEGGRSRIRFRSPVRAAAPGQAVVFYQDDLCLGGGWITKPSRQGSG